MAITSGFFDSQNGDRKYTAREMAQLFDGIIRDGIYRSIYDSSGGNKVPFKVTPGTGLQVIIKTGRAWANHCWIYNDGPATLNLNAAPASGQKRYDAVALKFDQGNRACSIVRFTGNATSGTPVKPDVHASDSTAAQIVYLPIAYVYINGGATSLTQQNIDQTCIGTDDAPYVTSPLESISVSEFVEEWRAEQIAWMQNFKTQIQNLLTDTEAGYLFNCIQNTGRVTLRILFAANKYQGYYIEAVKNNDSSFVVGDTITATDSENGYKSLYIVNQYNSNGNISKPAYGTWNVSLYTTSGSGRTKIGQTAQMVAYHYGYHSQYDTRADSSYVRLGTDKKITVTFDNAAFNGLTCTLKLGSSETYTAVIPSSGARQVSFDVLTNGTWTASVVVGGKTYSNSVTTSAAGNFTIAIKYLTELVILSSSVDKMGTGARVSGDSSSVIAKSGGKLTLTKDGYAAAGEARWQINADLTQYNTIKLTFARTAGSGGSIWWRVGTSASATKQTTTGTGVTASISGLSGTGNYIYLGYSGFNETPTATVGLSISNISVLP